MGFGGVEETLDDVARMALPHLGDLCIVSIVDDGRALARVAAAHRDADRQEELRRLMLARSPSGFEQRVVEADDWDLDGETTRAEAIDPALRDHFGVRSMHVEPLLARDHVLGVMTFCAADSGHWYGDEERAIARLLADRAALAVEHSQTCRRMEKAVRARDEFLAIASHDLKNMIAVLEMNTNILVRGAPAQERRGGRRQLDAIQRVATRMSELVRDLVDSDSIESGRFVVHPSPQSARALLAETMAVMRPLAAERGLTLETDLPPEDVEVRCDRTRILQVLTSLVGNALKFMPEGTVRLTARRCGDEVRFDVRDEGIGIAGGDVERIFDRYWRGAASGHHGVALGLYIAKSIVEAHGGRISVRSMVDGGTLFSFTLPGS